MPGEVNRYQVRDMVAEGAQLIEVLPPEDYNQWHLPGAVNIPLKGFDARSLEQLDKKRPIIVYCMDTQ